MQARANLGAETHESGDRYTGQEQDVLGFILRLTGRKRPPLPGLTTEANGRDSQVLRCALTSPAHRRAALPSC